VGDHAAADAGVVEQEMDLVGVVAVCDLIAKPLDLRRVFGSAQPWNFLDWPFAAPGRLEAASEVAACRSPN
jgi:hypothetical protein